MCSVVKCVCVCPSGSFVSSILSVRSLHLQDNTTNYLGWTDLVCETVDRLSPFPPPPADSSHQEGDVAVILLDVALQDVGAGAENALESVEVDEITHQT